MSEIVVKEESQEIYDTISQSNEEGLNYICPCELRGRVVESLLTERKKECHIT